MMEQPQPYYRPVTNSFNLLAGEKIYREWYYSDQGCCCPSNSYTTLTDVRILTRDEEYVCCRGCSESTHTDSSTSLRDIAQMRECRGEQPSFFFLLLTTVTCVWPCYVIRRIFCPKPKCLELFGAFGSEYVRLPQQEMLAAQVDLSTAVVNSKMTARF